MKTEYIESVGGKQEGKENTQDKTIFLVVEQGFSARYLLRTRVYSLLKEKVGKIVILTPNADEDYFRSEFCDDVVTVEHLNIDACHTYVRTHLIQSLCIQIRSYVLNGKYDMGSINDRYNLFLKQFKTRSFLKKIKLYLMRFIVFILRYSKVLRLLFLKWECCLFSPDLHAQLFEKYNPDLVIAASLGNLGGCDFFVLREAKKRKIATLVTILSWDNTTSKGMGAVIPDRVITWTDIMKEELINYHDYSPDIIRVGGIAHFDVYYNPEELYSKQIILKKYKLDGAKKIILFATKSPSSYPWNARLIEDLALAIMNKKIEHPAQILVRVHPLHFVMKRGEKRNAAYVTEYEELAKKYPIVHLDMPIILSDSLTMDMPKEEQVKIASLITHSDLMLSIFSTINIEAAIADVPIVNAAFEGEVERKCSLRHDIEIDKNHIHTIRVLKTGAMSVAYSFDDLVKFINSYLSNPSLHAEERNQMVKQEAGPYRGNACSVISDHICDILREVYR